MRPEATTIRGGSAFVSQRKGKRPRVYDPSLEPDVSVMNDALQADRIAVNYNPSEEDAMANKDTGRTQQPADQNQNQDRKSPGMNQSQGQDRNQSQDRQQSQDSKSSGGQSGKSAEQSSSRRDQAGQKDI